MATNEELDKFRLKWRQELQHSGHNSKGTAAEGGGDNSHRAHHGKLTHRHRRKSSAASHPSDIAPPLSPTSQKQPQIAEQLVGETGGANEASRSQAKGLLELTALEAYEQAVALETDGRLNDALTFYRRAYKLDPRVDKLYKEKYYPTSEQNAAVAVPSSSLSSVAKASRSKTNAITDMPPPMPTFKPPIDPKMKGKDVDYFDAKPKDEGVPSTEVLLQSFVDATILPDEKMPPTKKCWISMMPKEILLYIIRDVALLDIGSFVRLARVCKGTCLLVYSESAIWKEVSQRAWKRMCWGPKWKCDILGNEIDDESLEDEDEEEQQEQAAAGGATVVQDQDGYLWLNNSEGLPDVGGLDISEDKGKEKEDEVRAPLPTAPDDEQELVKYGSSWKRMFIERPRIRYNGVYIATCTYLRAGHHTSNTLHLTNAFHWVTYYRYLRFYPNGFVMSLLTTTEPSEVVYTLTLENWMRVRYHNQEGSKRHRLEEQAGLPAHSNILKAVLPGRWKFSFDPTSEDHTPLDGRVEIETEGAGGTWKYIYQMELWLKMRPKGGVGKKYSSSRADQLSWGKFYSFNRTSQDRAEFSLRNDKPFYFSRVKAYEREMGTSL